METYNEEVKVTEFNGVKDNREFLTICFDFEDELTEAEFLRYLDVNSYPLPDDVIHFVSGGGSHWEYTEMGNPMDDDDEVLNITFDDIVDAWEDSITEEEIDELSVILADACRLETRW